MSWADPFRSFTVGCKTEDGFTVILVERQEGVSTKPIKTSYSSTAGTAYITFDKVKVPVENTLGEEGGGIFVMLSNFNHERWVMCCTSARSQRGVTEECMKWVNQRKAFGKPLHSLAIVRSKLAGMIQRSESVQNWLENITYQMCNMVSFFLIEVCLSVSSMLTGGCAYSRIRSRRRSWLVRSRSSSPTAHNRHKSRPRTLSRFSVAVV